MNVSVARAISDASYRLSEAGIEDSQLETEVLYAHAAGLTRAQLLAIAAEPANQPVLAKFLMMVERRVAHEPLSYITGTREFYGIEISCDSRGLIPRPESEMLVDAAISEIDERGPELRIVDVGTGTGAIAIAIAASSAVSRIDATDSSRDALQLAALNAERTSVADRVVFEHSIFLRDRGEYDVILSNLPYVSESDWQRLPPEIREWEPREALVGGERGPELVCALLAEAPAHLAPEGIIAVEFGMGQEHVVNEAARQAFPHGRVAILRDLAGILRVLTVRCPPEART